jgi:hypothetical protein
MTTSDNLFSTPKSTNISQNGDIPEIDFGKVIQGIGTFLSGFVSAFAANNLNDATKIVKLVSGMSNQSQSNLIAVYNQQKAAIALLGETEEFAKNNPSKRVQNDRAIREIRAFISENYKDMADIISREIPSMRISNSKIAPLAEMVVRGLREEAVQVLDPRYPVRDIRPQDSQARVDSPNVKIASSLQFLHDKNNANNLRDEIIDPVLKNAAKIKNLFNLDVINSSTDRDVANYLMALSNGNDSDKIFETSLIFQDLSGKSAEDYKNAVAGKAIAIMDSGNEKVHNASEKASTHQL